MPQMLGSVEVGQQAPDFELAGPEGQKISLSEYRGKKNVVLVFFPLAFSPACSSHLPVMQQAATRFDDLDAVVLGISVDSHHVNRVFAQRLGLTFPLLSDFHRETSAAYGVLNAARGHSGRALFVIDREGRVIHKEMSVNPGDPEQFPSSDGAIEALRRAGSSESSER